MKKRGEQKDELRDFFVMVHRFFKRLGMDDFQFYTIMIVLLVLPIAWIFGFSAPDGHLVFKILFIVLLVLALSCIIYSIRKISKKKKRVKRSKNIIKRATPVHDSKQAFFDMVDNLDGIEFEYFIKDLYESLGYDAEVSRASGDYGVDVIATSDTEKLCIQAKRYADNVGKDAIQQIFSAKEFYNGTKAILITNRWLTTQATILARQHDIEVIERDKLYQLAMSARKNKGNTTSSQH